MNTVDQLSMGLIVAGLLIMGGTMLRDWWYGQ